MHVALNLAFLTPGEMGGLEVYSRQLATALAARDGIRLTMLLNRITDPAPWAALGEVTPLPLDPGRRVDWVRADQWHAPRAASAAGAQLLHCLASTAPVAGGLRRVVTVHDLNYLSYPEAHFGGRALGMRLLVPLAVRRSQRVIVPSRATREILIERLRADPAKVDVVPEGIGQPARPRGGGSERVAARLALDDRDLVLSVSAKRPHKNLARLIDALSAIPAEQRPVLALPGYPTPYEEELRRLATDRGVGESVRFLGWVSEDELEDLYAAATCFVFPSLQEGFGLPVLEAMARGVPVATSGRTSLAEVAGDAALLFDPEDERSIAQAIQRLLADRSLADRLRGAGREQAARFTWERTAEQTVASYRRALEALV